VQDDELQPVFTQFVADNVDHDIRTLDGTGTFHGMGIISATVHTATAESHIVTHEHHVIPRVSHRLAASEVVNISGVTITPFLHSEKDGLSTVYLKPFLTLHRPLIKPAISNLFLLQHVSTAFSLCDKPIPNWSEFMHQATTGPHASVGQITMHPLIDLQPSDDTCVYSTLLFVDNMAKRMHLPVTCVTFDQPLWLKAVKICAAADLPIVCRLGGFHLLMSYLGCIGHIMAGSGLQEMFQLCYGPNTVSHMITGKAYSRAVRGHLLVERALMVLLLQQLRTDEGDSAVDLSQLSSILQQVEEEKISADECSILCNSALIAVESLMRQQQSRLKSESQTARLWIEYLHWIDLLKHFIMAERTGNWHWHLEVTANMLPLFAAAGHHNYARSARLYVQQMNDLSISHPRLYEQFANNGCHTVRRTDQYWAAVSTDLLIEQTMMKSLKSQSGLTHGHGLTEAVRVHSMHESATYHLALKTVASQTTSDTTHTDCGVSRASRDCKDYSKIVEWLQQHNPFVVTDGKLRGLDSGVTAADTDTVNCDIAESIGCDIQTSFDDQRFTDTTIKKKNTVKTLAHLSCSTGQPGEHKLMNFDTIGLFHRLIVLIERSANIEPYFSYELTATPTALFKGAVMLKPVKPALVKELMKPLSLQEQSDDNCLKHDFLFVVDGGALLHCARWSRSMKISDIVSIYVNVLGVKYGQSAIVVFDGYECAVSTKDHEHKQRLAKARKVAPDITLTLDTPVTDDQQAFLANQKNKVSFIKLLSSCLRMKGFVVIEAEADADTDIVATALNKAANQQSVAVAADDTDILVLLVHHLNDEMHDILFVPQNRRRFKQVSIRDIQQAVGKQTCRQLLAVHAIGGCDTVSAIFGIGKGTVLKRLTAGTQFIASTDVLQDRCATVEDVISEGLKLLVGVYGGKPSESLNRLRYQLYCKMATESTLRPKPQRLPPTKASAQYHIMRAHLQAVRWSMLNASALEPTEWGGDSPMMDCSLSRQVKLLHLLKF